MMKYGFALILFTVFTGHAAFAGKDVGYYPYKDTKFDKVIFDQQFFSNILLEKDSANKPKYEEEKGIIKKQFPSSVITPFSFDALDSIETDNKTIIIVFRDHTDKKLHELLMRFLPIQPFADSFKEDGTMVSFAHVGENGCRFLIVKQPFNFQEERVAGKKLSGKDLAYVLDHLSNVAKVNSYRNRFRSYKPGDDYLIYRRVKDVVAEGGVAFERGYFEGSVYINPSLGFSITLPQWDTLRKVQKDVAREEGIGCFFGYMNLFLISKYLQTRAFPENPEMCLSVANVKEKSLESYLKENGYKNIEKGNISGKEIYTVRRSYPPKDHKIGRPLDHLPLIHRKAIFFKKNGLVGEMGIMYQNDEQGKELDKVLGTIQLK